MKDHPRVLGIRDTESVEVGIFSLASQPQLRLLSVSHTVTESDPHWGWLGLACETRCS